MEIQQFGSAEVAAAAAAALLNSLLEQTAGRPLLLLASGGSAMQLIHHIDIQALPEETTISVLDERFSTDPSVNNFSQLVRTDFMKTFLAAGGKTIDTTVREEDTLDTHAARFEEGLRHWHGLYPDGIVLATFGVGPDGHVSGVMPFPDDPGYFIEAFDTPERWVIGYDAQDKNPHRFRTTTTLSYLRNHVNSGVVYMAGNDKRDAFLRLTAEEGVLAETPARIFHEMRSLSLCTDIQ